MKRILLALAVSALVPAAALACPKDCGCHHDKMAKMGKGHFKMVTVAQVAKLEKTKTAQIFDANGPDLRNKEGIVPGAHLLSSPSSYSVAKELPHQKASKLVFYCANTRCLASHMAARRAVHAGYTDVSVMPAGIMGWKKAGEPTAKPSSAPRMF